MRFALPQAPLRLGASANRQPGAMTIPRPRPRLATPPSVPPWWSAHVRQFEDLAQRVTRDLPLRRSVEQTGGARSAERARQLGQEFSQHRILTAGDYVGTEAAMQEAARRWQRLHPNGYAVVHSVKGGQRHVHLQLFRKGIVPPSIYDALARGN